VSEALVRWNSLRQEEAVQEILPCCGSKTWATNMASKRPIADERSMLATSDAIWGSLGEADWLEAFESHPRIGESRAEHAAPAQSSAWSEQEQQKAAAADEAMKTALKWGNREYELKFGRIFIVCATGKSASEILEILRRRLQNDPATELRQAAEEQRQVMQIRIRKWLAG
jgi:2-oxo-4-hydroxy-4-carboxy-5-ureidoimidazoline decarboxylase